MLGRDAPAERLNHWLEVASQVEGFVGFAIGRSIWEDVISEIAGRNRTPEQTAAARTRIADTYLAFADHWVARYHRSLADHPCDHCRPLTCR